MSKNYNQSWGKIYTDCNYPTNFETGFVTSRNNVHVMLSQWQMWWWFWFYTLIALYLFIFIRIFLKNQDKFNPILNTSGSSKGKWGDFLVAIIPLSWCGNILVNSNFILRMIEWQNESSLFTIRIQGKQWYWSYKYSGDLGYKLKNLYINVGHNNWYKISLPSKNFFHYQTSNLFFIFDYEFKKFYLNNLKTGKIEKNYKSFKFNNLEDFKININNFFIKNNEINQTFIFNNFYKNKIKSLNFKELNLNLSNNKNIDNTEELDLKKFEKTLNFFKLENNPYIIKKNSIFFQNKNKNINYFENDSLEDLEEPSKNLRELDKTFPIKIIKGILNNNNINTLNTINKLNNLLFFNYKVNNTNITNKISEVEQFWGFKQKKYKKVRIYKLKNNYKYDNTTYLPINNYNIDYKINKYNLYTSVRNNKYKTELIPLTLAKRLLRVKRTLVLPAHINLTLITNSYDVVHSWFVPGLGLKIDCVPSRSTHHTLHIDHIGIYFGQYAEICGRYHHHMPIRVVALSFEHFLLWWHNKGLPRVYRNSLFLDKKQYLMHKYK